MLHSSCILQEFRDALIFPTFLPTTYLMERVFSRLLLLFVVLIQSCGGGGGSSSSSNLNSTSPVPLTVDTSSFVNKGASDLANFVVPNLTFITGTNGYTSIPETLAVADFQRTGQYSAFVVGEKTVSVGGIPTKITRGFFLKYDTASNSWSDISDQLFDPAADRSSCDDPRLGLVTKFNADERPDVYVVCAGSGLAVRQQMYVSGGVGGKYLRYESTFQVDATSASIADINGDQFADIVTNDGGGFLYKVFADPVTPIWSVTLKTRILVTTTPFPSFIRGVFLIPRNAERYLLVAGYGSSMGSAQNSISWYTSDASGAIDNAKSRNINISTPSADIYSYDYVERQQSLTMTYGYLYAYTRSGTTNAYKKIARIEAPLSDGSGPIASTNVWYYTGGIPSATSWPSRLTVNSGSLLPYDAGCLSNPVLVTDGRCALSFVDNWANFN